MKKLIITFLTVSAFITSTNCVAKSDKNVVFKATDNTLSFETEVCIIAATKGYVAAKEYLTANGRDYRTFNQTYDCNGTSLQKFAARYRDSRATVETVLAKASS